MRTLRNALLTGILLPLAGCSQDMPGMTSTEDARPSSLEVQNPTAGDWVDRDSMPVSGVTSKMALVRVDGVPVGLDRSGAFSRDIAIDKGINTVKVSATDEEGESFLVRRSVMNGETLDPDDILQDAVGIFLGPEGLSQVALASGDWITSEDLTSAIAQYNPVYSDTFTVDWLAVDLDLNIDSVTFETKELTVEPGSGVLVVEAVLRNLRVEGRTVASLYGLIEEEFETIMEAEGLRLVASLEPTLVDGVIESEVVGGYVELESFRFDIENISDTLEDILAGEAQVIVQDILSEKLLVVVEPLINDALSSFGMITETKILDTTFEVEGTMTRLQVTPEGMGIRMDLDIDVPSLGRTQSGFLSSRVSAPDFDETAVVETTISDNVVNLVLHQLWQVGAMELTFSSEEGSLDAMVPAVLDAAEVTVTTMPVLPPVVVSRDDELIMQFGELEVLVETPGGRLGEVSVWVLDGEALVQATVIDGAVTLELSDAEVNVVVRQNDWDMSVSEATELVEHLPLEMVLEALGEVALPLPEVPGVNLDSLGFSRESGDAHSSLVQD